MNYNSVVPHQLGRKRRQQSPPVVERPAERIPDPLFPADAEDERRLKRAARFAPGGSDKVKLGNTFDSIQAEEDYRNLNAISTKSHKFDKNKPVVGLCQTLEKSYLRLTSEPNPQQVRPLAVLRKAYDLIMHKYTNGDATYTYLCDQFKSIRQDLRVQMIENKFTLKVYQTHARLALQFNDLGEYNQCQSRLLALYALPSMKKADYEEFTSYLILYYILTDDIVSITQLKCNLLANNAPVCKHPRVKTAFALFQAKSVGNYHNFMKLANGISGYGASLVAAFLEKERLKALSVICQSYNQISLDFLSQELQFKDVDEAVQFCTSKSLQRFIVTKNKGQASEFVYLDARLSRPTVVQLYEKSKKIDIKGQK
ncbi:Thp3p KNAG_0F03540 [Huiozyma naganishii CBS 8797]|uniref:PCI domain-containing protein n=1 Tax=Huiozyma naganishii (strain ATCC MYA-139 / BCRC 22969 / CBS 8797 / KCTC 17520 / NBRC 10181 / NCYC 3082 / Yp74L-3) TaxID=1071383 RepID=J7S8P7_HUIN7|nr:hypothetical protein KNAG_0F03540 [Kazachstania naganishii CBS 8797]CCK71016.1 hypothetical protein KNAG_0F03540 [Kazachstania naganishii CBS 8797]